MRLCIGHVPIDLLTFQEALQQIALLIEQRQGGFVVTPNVDHVVLADSHLAFREAYAQASLSLADGQPLVWLSPWIGKKLPEKISGADLVWPLLEMAAQKSWRVYFLGANPEVTAKARQVVLERYGTNVVGCDSPFISLDSTLEDNQETLDKIKEAHPHLILVALGAPKQELWMHRFREYFAPAIALGIGASLDFIAGTLRRAPPWVSRCGLEWAYRLLKEPRRLWRRYLVNDPKFLGIFLRTLRRPRNERVLLSPNRKVDTAAMDSAADASSPDNQGPP
jgi:N-acetylglucosaminyldiphosphoundecaprenol N-acetyl-beta-D-mannosaminyltransferase